MINEPEAIDMAHIIGDPERMEEYLKVERRIKNDRITKCSSYQNPNQKLNMLDGNEPYTLTDAHKNHQIRYANISAGISNENTRSDLKYSNPKQRYSYNREEMDEGSGSNFSNEVAPSTRFKNVFNSTPMGPTGPIKLPFISGGSPSKSEVGHPGQYKMNPHQYSVSDSSNYAIGAGKTTSSSNLKATVSGGNMSITGGKKGDKKDRIEYF